MKHFITFLFIFGSLLVKAQEDYLITLEGDTIFGKITVIQGTAYDKVSVKNEDGTNSYPAFKVQSAVKGNETTEPIVFLNKRIMAKVLIKGSLSYMEIKKDGAFYDTRILYRHKDEKALEISNIGFRKRILSFLDDCDQLKSKIESKKLGSADIQEIIRDYDLCATSKGPKHENLSQQVYYNDLKTFSELFLDITLMVESGEEIPEHMIQALQGFSNTSIDEKIKNLLEKLNQN